MREKKVVLKLTRDEAVDLLQNLACRKDYCHDQAAVSNADNLDYWQWNERKCEALLVHVRKAL